MNCSNTKHAFVQNNFRINYKSTKTRDKRNNYRMFQILLLFGTATTVPLLATLTPFTWLYVLEKHHHRWSCSVTITGWGFWIMFHWFLSRCSRQPWRNWSGGGLFSQTVMADDCVEPPSGSRVLCWVVGFKRCWYTALMLVHKSIWATVIVGEGFVYHKKYDTGKKCKSKKNENGHLEPFWHSVVEADGEFSYFGYPQFPFVLLIGLEFGSRFHHNLVWGRELQMIHIQGCDQRDGVKIIIATGLLGILFVQVTPQLHHCSRGRLLHLLSQPV